MGGGGGGVESKWLLLNNTGCLYCLLRVWVGGLDPLAPTYPFNVRVSMTE